MKKILFILCFITIICGSLNAISLIADGLPDQIIKLSELSHLEIVKFDTHRDKRGVVSDDAWEGYFLKDILNLYNVTDYEMLEINSDDNYQVKYSLEEVEQYKPILAYKRNGKTLKDHNLRVVSETRMDMYWASDLNNIKTVKTVVYPSVRYIYLFSYLQDKIALYDNPKPFTSYQGFFFRDMKEILANNVRLPVRLETKDKFISELTYDKFLKKAVMLKNETGGLDLRSPTMPAGMWPKNLFIVTFDDTVVLFDHEMRNIEASKIREIFSLSPDAKVEFDFVEESNIIRKIEIK
ncbi:MAG: molybdopterin-dependent oxidoreductase [Candidatus Cloacimonetes bacterium]|nr:molybdopterin-dependent oxidoreductase [Candidatus Cloacimonadota bacterium]MDD2650391.1 molybdopterin-dependent oxidoreductase [Candidatus Cloacimonadota bacterium]MDD3502298.1 molybdopterin-dependent oxidoreductase [Candidatus Cloacimonadota bacterium]